MKTNRLRSGCAAWLSALLCLLAGLIFGFLLMMLFACLRLRGSGALTFSHVVSVAYAKGLKPLLLGSWSMADAAPLIMAGLSVSFAYQAGLVNLGASGQYIAGALAALACALLLKLPWYTCLLGALLAGALWGAIPGVFGARFGVHEAVVSFLTNWIILYGGNALLKAGGSSALYDAGEGKTRLLAQQAPSACLPSLSAFGSRLFAQPAVALLIAVLAAVILWLLLNKTTFGYELRVCGSSRAAAHYAGIDEKKNAVACLSVAGALGGLGGALYALAGSAQWSTQTPAVLPNVGLYGIAAAVLACGHPLGTVFSSLFIAHLTAGAAGMDASLFPPETAGAVIGAILFCGALTPVIRKGVFRLLSRKDRGGAKP